MRSVKEKDEVTKGSCNHKKIRVSLNLDEITILNRCVQCCIILADNPLFMPYKWNWKNSGRHGDLCNGCCYDMRIADKKRLDKLVSLGCVVCKKEIMVFADAEIHHLRDGRGVGQKKDHSKTIPLCPMHHRIGGHGIAFHAGQAEWESRHGRETSLLEEVDEVLLTLGFSVI